MRKVLLAAIFLCSLASAQSTVTVIKAARLFDAKSDKIVQPGIVVVAGKQIQSVSGQIPANATVIDLGDATLLPGFIDSHTHLTMAFNPDYNGGRDPEVSPPAPEEAIRASEKPRRTIMDGVTTVRGDGSFDFLGLGLRNPSNAGGDPRPGTVVA